MVDKVVLACGYEADRRLYYELKDKVSNLYLIGDASQARNIQSAIYEGTMVAYQLKASF